MDDLKHEIDIQAAKGESSNIWVTFQGLAQTTASSVNGYDYEPQELENKIHFLWYVLIHGAQNLSPDELGQYHMLYASLNLQELGTLAKAETASDIQKSSNHKRALPYLAEDLRAHWSSVHGTQKNNLIGFTAKMLSVGICEESFVELTHNSLKIALQDSTKVPTVSELRELRVWLAYAADKIALVCAREMYGMSPTIWLSYHTRLAEIALGSHEELAIHAMEAYLIMYECVWRTDNPMRPGQNMLDHRPIHVQFLKEFCDQFPNQAKPGWKQLVEYQRSFDD